MLEAVLGLVVSLLCYINVSFTIGVFPEILKIAKVLLLHKGGAITDINNLRPIFMLSMFDKITEKIMLKYLYAFLEENGVLDERQFGFRERNSSTYF